jgi:hypothetical protein
MISIWSLLCGVDVGALSDGERRNTLVHWPASVDKRLDVLLDLMAASGGRASRAQLLAALVATAPLDGPRLERQIRRYRQLDEDEFTAGASDIPAPRTDPARPGPRSRSPRQDP